MVRRWRGSEIRQRLERSGTPSARRPYLLSKIFRVFRALRGSVYRSSFRHSFMKILLALLLLVTAAVAAPFEIKEGDRILLLGDALLERENAYGDLELRMHEQFPKTRFTVRNLSWSG